MTAIGEVSLNGLMHERFQYVFNLKDGITEADEGKALAIDTSAKNTLKLAGDGDRVIARLERAEKRVAEGILIGMASLQGGMKFLTNPDASASSPDELPAVGDYLEGAADDSSNAGYVQRSTTHTDWLVVEIADDNSYCIAIRV